MEFAVAGFGTQRAVVVAGGQQQLQIDAAQFADFVAVYAHFHPRFRGYRARSHNPHAFHFHQTQTARAVGGQFGVIAERNNVEIGFTHKFQQVFFAFDGDSFPFDSYKVFVFRLASPSL